jgi:hypothetical protein
VSVNEKKLLVMHMHVHVQLSFLCCKEGSQEQVSDAADMGVQVCSSCPEHGFEGLLMELLLFELVARV